MKAVTFSSLVVPKSSRCPICRFRSLAPVTCASASPPRRWVFQKC